MTSVSNQLLTETGFKSIFLFCVISFPIKNLGALKYKLQRKFSMLKWIIYDYNLIINYT